jgi:hypothetical protein
MRSLGQLTFYVFIAGVLLIPLASTLTIPANLDFLGHLANIVQAKLALQSGQFPLRLAPTDHQGWAYPVFQFYSSSTYTIAGFLHQWLSPENPWIAMQLTLAIALIIGAYYMQRLAYWFIPLKSAAFLACLVYFTSPYTYIVIHQLGAFNEAIALCVLPAVWYYQLRLYQRPQGLTFVKSALGWYLLATIHLITFLCSSVFAIVFLLALTFKTRQWRNFFVTSFAYVFALELAAWFLGPIFKFSPYLIANRTFNDAQTFFAHSLSLFDLFKPLPTVLNKLRTADGYIDVIARIHPNLSLPISFAFACSLYALWTRQFFLTKTPSEGPQWILILFIVALFLVGSPVNFWAYLPQPFLVLQYSWRLLGQVNLFGSILFAWMVYWIFKQELALRYLFAVIIFIVLVNSVWMFLPAAKFNNYQDVLPNYQTGNFYIIDAAKHTNLITAIENHLRKDKILTIKQVQPTCQQHKSGTHCNILVPDGVAIIELPMFYYPQLLNIRLNGAVVPYFSILREGFLITGIVADPGKLNRIKVNFQGLVSANIISQFAWLLWLLLSLFFIFKKYV